MTQRLGRWGIVLVPRRWFAFWAGSDCEWWISLPFSINQQKRGFIFTSSLCGTEHAFCPISQDIKKQRRPLWILLSAKNERRRENYYNILRLSALCFCLLVLILSLYATCLWHHLPKKLYLWICLKGKDISPEEKAKVNKPYGLFCLYSSILSVSPSSTSRPFRFRLTQVTAFYSESHFSLMDILSTDSFWFRLLMLSASPNIHFGCSAPSHWFLWRWNSDWTDLSWRPRTPTCVSTAYERGHTLLPERQTTWRQRTSAPCTAWPIFKYNSFM